MIWARGRQFCADLGRGHPISWKLRFGRKNWFSHDLSSGTGSAPIWAVSTQFHENCDSAVKIEFSWNWVPTAQIGAEPVPELRSWENQFLRPNRNFHEIELPTAQIGADLGRGHPISWKFNFYGRKIVFSHEIWAAHGPNRRRRRPWAPNFMRNCNFYGRNRIFSWLGAHGPNRRRTRPRAQIMRKSIFTAESQFSWNWVPTAQIGAEPGPWAPRFHEKLRFLRP